MHAPLRRRKRAVSILRVPPFWPETGKTLPSGGEFAAANRRLAFRPVSMRVSSHAKVYI